MPEALPPAGDPEAARIITLVSSITLGVDARHWLDGDLWRPIGTYRWTLERAAGRWAITSMTLILTAEIGDRGLAAKAAERAKTG